MVSSFVYEETFYRPMDDPAVPVLCGPTSSVQGNKAAYSFTIQSECSVLPPTMDIPQLLEVLRIY